MSLYSVFISTDWDISLGVLTHNVLAPPAVPTPTPMISAEMICTMKWLGFFMNQNKLTTTVKHANQTICQTGHDSGMMIPDITIPIPANIWYAIMWPFSSRKIAFAASTVKMNGQPTGCAQMLLIPQPMMTCGDPIGAPTGLVMFNCFTSTVKVGMSLADLLIGLAGIALSILIDFIFEKIGNGGESVMANYGRRAVSRSAMERVARTAAESVANQLAREGFNKLGLSANSALKRGVSAAAGLLTSALEGNPTWKYSVGAPPFAGGEVSIDSQGPAAQAEVAGVQANTRGDAAAWGSTL